MAICARKTWKVHLNITYCLRICRGFGEQIQLENENTMVSVEHDFKLSTSEINITETRGRFVTKPLRIEECNGDHAVKRQLDVANEGGKILGIIEKYQMNIQNASIFGKAIQKCNVLRDWSSAQKVMNLLLSSNAKPSLTEFNVFMNTMTRSDYRDALTTIMDTFDSMIHKYKIDPDIVTFGILLKALTKELKYKEAQKSWSLMINKYKLQPNEMVYTQMMAAFARCIQMDSATKLFEEYMQKVKEQKLNYHVPVINAYLSACGKSGDLKQIQNVLNRIPNTNVLNDLSISTIMNCFLSARKFKKCLKLHETWMNQEGNKCNEQMLHMKCYSIARLINSNKISFEKKQKLYEKLKYSVYSETQLYGFTIPQLLVKTHLEGAIFLYADHDPMEIVKVFESLLENNLFGYFAPDRPGMIDFHGYQSVDAQFVIRYIFGFKNDYLMECCQRHGNVTIIVGKGYHSAGVTNERGSLKDFLIGELKSWNPPINARVDRQNRGRLVIDASEMKCYAQNQENFARQLLTSKDSNWCHLNQRNRE